MSSVCVKELANKRKWELEEVQRDVGKGGRIDSREGRGAGGITICEDG